MATSSKTGSKTPAKAAAKPAAEAEPKAAVKAAPKAVVKAATKEAAAPVETEAKAASPAAEKTAAPAKRGAKKKAVNVSPEQRHNYVQIAAYYVAERHGFTSGREAADWAEGEAEIDRLLAGGHFNP